MKSPIKPMEVQEVATRRIDRLRSLSFEQVAALPERRDEAEQVRDREVAVTTYRARLSDGRIRVVVQAYFHRFLGIGTMTADGFIVAPDNTKTSVPQDMMWEFI